MSGKSRVDACVETLCAEGCSIVWNKIELLESGEKMPETEALDASEKAAVLLELKTVMAVYEGTCSID